MHVKPVRYQDLRWLHFIPFRCYHRMPLLDPLAAKQTFERDLERVRGWYSCSMRGNPHFSQNPGEVGTPALGYVVMPAHVHLLISEPERLASEERVSDRGGTKEFRVLRRAKKRPPQDDSVWGAGWAYSRSSVRVLVSIFQFSL